jgi:hypothetical protein
VLCEFTRTNYISDTSPLKMEGRLKHPPPSSTK